MAKYTLTITDATEEEIRKFFGTVELPPHLPTQEVENEATESNENEIDSEGLLWDDRIHSSSKTKNKDGKWKRKKGVDEIAFITIKNEILSGQPQTVPTPPAPPAPPVQSAPPIPPVLPVAESKTFEELMGKLNELFSQNKIQPAYISGLAERLNKAFADTNLSNIMEIQGEQELIDTAWELLEKDGHA